MVFYLKSGDLPIMDLEYSEYVEKLRSTSKGLAGRGEISSHAPEVSSTEVLTRLFEGGSSSQRRWLPDEIRTWEIVLGPDIEAE